MHRLVRSGIKGVAQQLLGKHDVRAFVRQQKLWLSKKLYRRPIAVAELRQQLIDIGVTRGRTLWVQSSWNEFYNLPMKPSELIGLLCDLLGENGTLAMPAFPIDQNPDKVFLVDRASVYTGLLCEVFRRTPGVKRSIQLSSSVCAIGPNADFLVKDHHLTDMPWGKDSPFCRLADVDARILGLGAGFEYLTPLHAVECLLHDEVPFFRKVFDGTIRYRWKRANGETGEHEFRRRSGDIRPGRLRRYFGPDLCVDAKLSNLKMIGADAKPFIEHAVMLGRTGVTVYVQPKPDAQLFKPSWGLDHTMDHEMEMLASSDDILARIRDVFRAELDDANLTIDLDTLRKDIKAWDSLAHMHLVWALEGEFDVKFSVAEIEETRSVRQFFDAINKHRRERS